MQDEISSVKKMLSDESCLIEVQKVANGLPDWKVSEGRLFNSRADYFSLGAALDETGAPRFIMRQTEPVLVMLFVRLTSKGFSVLASIRSEPGLIGLSCLTSTIQSTQSNYMRAHGGKSTPYLEFASNVIPERVILDSTQYDWGDHYEGKTKRFLILWADDKVEEREGFVWINLRALQKLLVIDNLISNDFRTCIALLIGALERQKSRVDISEFQQSVEINNDSKTPKTFNYLNLELLGEDSYDKHQYNDAFGNSINFYQTSAVNR